MNCRHCGQAAIARDAKGPICPDCVEEGYAEPFDKRPVAKAKLAEMGP